MGPGVMVAVDVVGVVVVAVDDEKKNGARLEPRLLSSQPAPPINVPGFGSVTSIGMHVYLKTALPQACRDLNISALLHMQPLTVAAKVFRSLAQ